MHIEDAGKLAQFPYSAGRRLSQSCKTVDPFPELSASSDDELVMRSNASSFSSTRSSSSSRSSLARLDQKTSHLYGGGGGGSSMPTESYVECHQVPMRGNSGISHLHSHPKVNKPTRVASFISEEPVASPTAARPKSVREEAKRNENGDFYVTMALPSDNKRASKHGRSKEKSFSTSLSNVTQSEKTKSSSVSKQQRPSSKMQVNPARSILQQVQNKLTKTQQQAKAKPPADEKLSSALYVDMAANQPPLPQPVKPSKPVSQSEKFTDSYTIVAPVSSDASRVSNSNSDISKDLTGSTSMAAGSNSDYSLMTPGESASTLENKVTPSGSVSGVPLPEMKKYSTNKVLHLLYHIDMCLTCITLLYFILSFIALHLIFHCTTPYLSLHHTLSFTALHLIFHCTTPYLSIHYILSFTALHLIFHYTTPYLSLYHTLSFTTLHQTTLQYTTHMLIHLMIQR